MELQFRVCLHPVALLSSLCPSSTLPSTQASGTKSLEKRIHGLSSDRSAPQQTTRRERMGLLLLSIGLGNLFRVTARYRVRPFRTETVETSQWNSLEKSRPVIQTTTSSTPTTTRSPSFTAATMCSRIHTSASFGFCPEPQPYQQTPSQASCRLSPPSCQTTTRRTSSGPSKTSANILGDRH